MRRQVEANTKNACLVTSGFWMKTNYCNTQNYMLLLQKFNNLLRKQLLSLFFKSCHMTISSEFNKNVKQVKQVRSKSTAIVLLRTHYPVSAQSFVMLRVVILWQVISISYKMR